MTPRRSEEAARLYAVYQCLQPVADVMGLTRQRVQQILTVAGVDTRRKARQKTEEETGVGEAGEGGLRYPPEATTRRGGQVLLVRPPQTVEVGDVPQMSPSDPRETEGLLCHTVRKTAHSGCLCSVRCRC